MTKVKLTALQKKNIKAMKDREKRLIRSFSVVSAPKHKNDISNEIVSRTWRDPKTGELGTDNEIEVSIGIEGSIRFHDRYLENYIYFYPEQIECILVRIAKARQIGAGWK